MVNTVMLFNRMVSLNKENGMQPFTVYFFKSSVHFLLNKFFAVLLGLILMLSVGQVWGQTITNVSVTGTPVCAGSTVNLSFLVTNGTSMVIDLRQLPIYYVFLNSTQ